MISAHSARRQHADDLAAGDAARGRLRQRLAKGIERAGADVAIDDANGAKGQGGEGIARLAAGVVHVRDS